MIPTEAVRELCLCMTADDEHSIFSVGVVRAGEVNLRSSKNKDQKRWLNDDGIAAVSWLAEEGELAENLLLHLDEATRSVILDYELSGQKRVNQLFRHIHGRLVRREVVLTVAQRDDGPKRVRDARKHLQPEGIIILGHQGSHPRIAAALGMRTPPKGSWIVTKVVAGGQEVVPAEPRLAGDWRPTVKRGGSACSTMPPSQAQRGISSHRSLQDAKVRW